MASGFGMMRGTPKAGFALFGFLKRYWYWVIFAFFLIPSIIISIQFAVETNNPTFPFFDLATRILAGDNSLDNIIDTLRENPAKLIGMEKPEEGIWKKTIYGWKYFWKVIYRIIGDVWLIFLPLYIIFNIIHLSGDRSMPAKNFKWASIIFISYLILASAVISIYKIAIGEINLVLPTDIDKFKAYYLLIIHILPFHGIWNLITFLIQKAIGTTLILKVIK